MIYHPIMIRNVKHLTDARYFAAMGVDWMSIELTTDPASFMLWHTLRSWVAGVMLAAEIDTNDEMLFAKTIIDAKPEGMVMKDDSFVDLPAELTIFYKANSPNEITADHKRKTILIFNDRMPIDVLLKIPSDTVFLQARWTDEMLRDILEKGYAGGICFTGGDEDITGVRDYGAIDQVMEILGR